MSKQIVLDENMLALFFATMWERQEIWYKRFLLKEERPWTTDDIFNSYKFCNVYRELDRSSQWLLQNVIWNNKYQPINKLFKMMVYRLYNNPEVFNTIKLPDFETYSAQQFIQDVNVYESLRPSTNSKAYCINTWLSKGQSAGMANATIIVPSIYKHITEIWQILQSWSSVNDLINCFKKIAGIGNFVSHEWFIDLCYYVNYNGGDFEMEFDENSYTSVGPGAINGLKLLTESKVKPELVTTFLRDMAPDCLMSINEQDQFKFLHSTEEHSYYVSTEPNITLHTIEFWLCEFNKYVKVLNKYGRQRDAFIPITGNNHFL
jgi:hypothetical protein